MSGLALFHVVSLSFWAGMVAVELVLELAGRRGAIAHGDVALLHRWIDRGLEVPTLVLVVGSGLMLWSRTGYDGALLPKVGLGLGAVLANLVCAVFVERRAVSTEPEAHFRGIAATVVVGLPLALGALFLGGSAANLW